MCLPAQAERADRGKPLDIMADKGGSIDMLRQVVVFTGNVVITKGTLTIKADRVEVREGPDGFRNAVAIGSSRPATFRQKRDGVDEYIDGQADRLEYEERSELIRFVNRATVRRLRGKAVGDEITGNLITYDGTSEVFSVSGGSGNSAASNAGGEPQSSGRVRAVLSPREGSEAAEAAAAQSNPAPIAPPPRNLPGAPR
jgi:lipopolysaccharide export system protein LptA